jgi:hypothetical protein
MLARGTRGPSVWDRGLGEASGTALTSALVPSASLLA